METTGNGGCGLRKNLKGEDNEYVGSISYSPVFAD